MIFLTIFFYFAIGLAFVTIAVGIAICAFILAQDFSEWLKSKKDKR